MYIQVTYRTGRTVWIEKFRRREYPKGEKREKRGKPTPEQKQKENALQAKRGLTRLLEENFCGDDYFVTLTYAGDPPTQEEAKVMLAKFIRGVRCEYRKRDAELKYIIVTEWHGKRIHHHLVMNGIPETPQLLRKYWPHGRPGQKLLDESGEYGALAEYLLKETEKTFRDPASATKKRYTPSRNLIRPEPERKRVSARTFRQNPKPPEGYEIVKGSLVTGVSEVTGYMYQYYKLLRVREEEEHEERRKRKRAGGPVKNDSRSADGRVHRSSKGVAGRNAGPAGKGNGDRG